MKKDAKEEDSNLEKTKICFLGNFPPKECGIATFTEDLSSAMNKKFNPKLKSKVIALNEDSHIYNYSNNVIMEINKDDIDDYISTAKKVNESKDIKLICIQHEFGIFGGNYGNHLIPFLELVEKPVVVTLHSVVPDPSPQMKRVVKSLNDKCSAMVVMANSAIEILKRDYEVEEEKLFFVPHGIPNVSFLPQESFKKKLNLDGKIVISTFGLLSKGKGVENMIRALPNLVEKYPNLLFLVIGETHPVVRREEGEEYRNKLIEEVKELGLQKHVKFYNKYLLLEEIIEYLLATDIYTCTNLDRNQIVSGTLSYAMGCGRVSIASPSVYAKEVLAADRGIVVVDDDPELYAQAIDKVLSNQELKKFIERNAYVYGRSMIWPNVAISYLKVFNKAIKLREEIVEKLPIIKLDHLVRMTDEFGMMQFSNHSEPDPASGYTIDDNSRALIVSTLHNRLFKSGTASNLSETYLRFIEKYQDEHGWFHNVISEDELSNCQSEDAFGRTIWALGYTIKKSRNQENVKKAEELLRRSIGMMRGIKSPRAVAFLIIGLCHYYKKFPNEETLKKIKRLATYLQDRYVGERSDDWHWFEETLAYSNSKLPEAMYSAYEIIGQKEYLDIAEESLKFLTELTFVDGKLHLIGQDGWCKRNGKRAFFDQQPVDAASLVQTYLKAYEVTKKREYYKKAVISFNWFLGKNHLNQMVYDEITGGCFDGVGKYALNMNQGAESTLSYLIARLFLEEIKQKVYGK